MYRIYYLRVKNNVYDLEWVRFLIIRLSWDKKKECFGKLYSEENKNTEQEYRKITIPGPEHKLQQVRERSLIIAACILQDAPIL